MWSPLNAFTILMWLCHGVAVLTDRMLSCLIPGQCWSDSSLLTPAGRMWSCLIACTMLMWLFARSHRAYVILFDLWTMFWLYLVLTAALTERMWFFVSMPGQCWPDSTAVLRNVYSILAGPTGGLFSYDALTMSMRICLILSSTSTVRVCDLFLMPSQCLTQNPLFQKILRLLQNVHQSNPSRNQCGNSISNPECSRNLSNYDFSVFVFVFVQVSQLAGNCYKKLLHQSWLFFELIVKGWLLITNIFLTSAILLIALSLKRI